MGDLERPVALPEASSSPYQEYSLNRAAEWCYENGLVCTPILAEYLAREAATKAAPSISPAPPAVLPGGPTRPLVNTVSDDPEVIRGPHGFSFTYSPTTLPASQEPEAFDPSKHPEWIARIEEFQRVGLEMERARLADPMPDPDVLTVGEMIKFITFLSRTPMEWLANPIIGQQYNRRDVVLLASPGWKAFLDWKDRARLHRLSRLEAAERLRDEVGERTAMLTREIESMPLMDAVRLLEQPGNPAGPTGPSPSGNRGLGRPSGHRRPMGSRPPPNRPGRLRDECQAAGVKARGSLAPPSLEAPDLVTLNQAAGLVHKSKRTLERYKTVGKLPAPAVEGGGGKADLYDWKVLGPWLESKFGIRQPKVFPANRRHR